MRELLRVTHSGGSCPIRTGSMDEAVAIEGAAWITDENVARAWGSRLPALAPKLVLPAGESTKSLGCYGLAVQWLAGLKSDRATPIVAFGGGVIGDLAGFVAATYMRGVPFIQIPTSLLAQVDSSVGGKVAIDLPEGKNLVGAFYPPTEVRLAMGFLETLSDRHFVNGMAEVWKYAFIMDPEMLAELESRAPTLGDTRLDDLVARCVRLKAKLVEKDELDRLGIRAILNFGHTIGHAIEFLDGYRNILHGEAIAVGMVVEARLGVLLGMTPPDVPGRIESALRSQGLPTSLPPGTSVDRLVDAMRGDKKASRGQLAFSLLSGVGTCKLVEHVPEGLVRQSLMAT